MHSLLEKIRSVIRQKKLLEKGERVIVGFSGGIDSVCLLHLLADLTDYNLDLWAVYINHCLRPDENIREKQLLYETGKRLGIRTKEIILNIPERLRQKPQSLQLLAREERYRIFLELRQELGASKIALAHHRDDQAETVLYRIIRGTGIDGLSGIQPIRDGIFIRPLLQFSRAEIAAYVVENNLSWVEDSSNQKLIYQRNRIRRELIPEIEKNFNPRFKDALVRLSELAAEQSDFMDTLVSENLKTLLVIEHDRIGFRQEPFLQLHSYLQYCVLRKIITVMDPAVHLEFIQLKRLLDKVRSEINCLKPIQIQRGIFVYFEKGVVFFEASSIYNQKNFTKYQDQSYPVTLPGETWIPESNLKVTAELAEVPTEWSTVDRLEAYFDVNSLQPPVSIRYWQPGDFFRPLGTGGTQKLQDFFMNNKIPRTDRNRIPLLVDAQGRIAWIIGYRLSEDFKVKNPETRAWHITVEDSTAI